jgi:hypothetical protein
MFVENPQQCFAFTPCVQSIPGQTKIQMFLKSLELYVNFKPQWPKNADSSNSLPSGVLVKSTAQGIIQTCNATLKLVKILIDKIGLSPFFTARLQKRALWTQMVEHSLFREKMK